MSWTTLPLAALAGGLTILSPCILPIAPVVLSSAIASHRFGGLALSLGLGVSFALIGVGLTLLEAAFGFDTEIAKKVGGVMMILIGLWCLVPKPLNVLAMATAPVSSWASEIAAPIKGDNLVGQFGIGALLALIWSPCVGPTLGAAFVLSTRAEDLGWAAATMISFAFGASATLLGLGFLVRGTLKSHGALLKKVADNGRLILGGSMLCVGCFVLSGLDEVLSRIVVDISPEWIIALTTRF